MQIPKSPSELHLQIARQMLCWCVLPCRLGRIAESGHSHARSCQEPCREALLTYLERPVGPEQKE